MTNGLTRKRLVIRHSEIRNSSFYRYAQLSHQARQVPPRFAGRVVRVVDVRIELDGDPTAVAGLVDFQQRRPEVNRAMAGDEMLVDARCRDLLAVVMGRWAPHLPP